MKTEIEFFNTSKNTYETRVIDGNKVAGIIERNKARRTKNVICRVAAYNTDTFETIEEVTL